MTCRMREHVELITVMASTRMGDGRWADSDLDSFSRVRGGDRHQS